MADKKLVDEYVGMGGGGDTSALSNEELLALMEELAYADKPKPTYVQDAFVDQASQDLYQQATGKPWQNTADALALASNPDYQMSPAPIKAGTLTDEQMKQIFETNTLPEGLDVDELIDEAALRKMTDGRDFITNLTDPQTAMYVMGRMGAQAGGSAINTLDLPATAAGLYGLTSMGVDGIADIITGGKGSPLPGGPEATDYANDQYKKALGVFGVGEPRNVQESLAGVAGMMIPIPGPSKMNAAQNIAEVVTPFVIGPKKIPRIASNFAVSAAADQVIREVVDAEDASYETIFDAVGLPEDMGSTGTIAATAVLATAPLWGPVAIRQLAGAKAKAPMLKSKPVTPRLMSDVEAELPDDLYTITTAKDELGQYVLEDGGILGTAAERAGVSNIATLKDEIEIGSGMAAKTRVAQAMDDGKLFTTNGNYTAPVSTNALQRSMSMLPPQVQADYDRYLKLGDYIDNINARRAMGSTQPNDAAELAQLTKWRSDMRTIYPELGNFSKAVQQNTEASRAFMSEGPYALLTKARKADLDKYQSHYIPLSRDAKAAGDSVVKRLRNSPVQHLYGDELGLLEKFDVENVNLAMQGQRGAALDELQSYTQHMLELQVQNSARGQWIDQMLNSNVQASGKPLIRLATSKEVDDYAKRGMIVPLYRQGKREMYITEPLIAQALRMDPNVLANPVYAAIHGSRRAFEQMTTGVVTGTFPIVTGIRDTVAGAIMAPKGVKGPTIPGSIAAPVRILGPKVFKAIYEDLNARLANNMPAWYLPGMDQAGMQQLSARLANAYQNSIYHMANEAGGIDASIMRTNVRKAKGRLEELVKMIPAPVSRTYGKTMGRLINGLAQSLDSLQEAPRFDAFYRNVKAGMSPEQAAKEARNLTGNTNKSGRYLDSKGRIIRGVLSDQDSVLGVINPFLGGITEAARLAIPYVHPSIQGMRRVAYAAKSDPVRFAQRAWLMMGMPAMGAWAWNKMISSDSEEGYDYDGFATENRPSRDQIMEMYIGIPGLPPEQGISIPIAHEVAPFMSPFQTFLAHVGDSGEEQMRAMTQTGLGLLENMGGLSLPPAVNAVIAATGNSPPQSFTNLDSYPIREDNVLGLGFMPENMEVAARAMFGQMAGTAIDVGTAFMDDGELQDAMDEYMSNTMARVPIAKGVGGWRKYSSAFTPLASEQREVLSSYNRFKQSWDEYYGNPKTVQRPQSKTADALTVQDPKGGEEVMLPFAKVGAEPIARPINPLYELYGEQVRDAFEKNEYGMLDTEYQLQVLSEQIRYLNGYNAGRADDFRKLQEELKTAPQRRDELQKAMAADPSLEAEYKAAWWQAKTAEFIDANNIDLGNRFDVVDLGNVLENWRSEVYRKQLSIVNQVEDDITKQLQATGQLRPDQRFSIRKHLDPMADPLNIREPVSPAPSAATAPQ